jgi:hypothetical protein
LPINPAVSSQIAGQLPINPAASSQIAGQSPINSAASSQIAGQLPNALSADMTQGAAEPISPDKAEPDANAQNIQQACEPEQLKGKGSPDSKKPGESQKPHDPSQPNQTLVMPFMPLAAATSVMNEQNQANAKGETQQIQKALDPASISAPATQPPTISPELQRAWADVKKFEFNVQTGTSPLAGTQVQPQGPQADAQKDAIVTTDPIANIQLQQLPPRITAIEKLVPDGKLADRPKPGAGRDSTDTSTTVPTIHFGDVTKAVEQVEQAQPAHLVELPQAPHVQVLRTVSMEVGDADSQVTVRIQERAGDISMQINAANEPLHQDLQSSVGSLIHALKQEQVQVSNVDVSRKSPIDKVRRMKEAHS